jgi:hypothetical protein
MDYPAKKLLGWDITLLKKQYFITTKRANVIGWIVSLPFLYNYYQVANNIYKKKKETGLIKLSPTDAMRVFGTDFTVITFGLATYLALKNKAGLTIASRYL